MIYNFVHQMFSKNNVNRYTEWVRSLDPFHIPSHGMKWVKTSWKDSIEHFSISFIYHRAEVAFFRPFTPLVIMGVFINQVWGGESDFPPVISPRKEPCPEKITPSLNTPLVFFSFICIFSPTDFFFRCSLSPTTFCTINRTVKSVSFFSL